MIHNVPSFSAISSSIEELKPLYDEKHFEFRIKNIALSVLLTLGASIATAAIVTVHLASIGFVPKTPVTAEDVKRTFLTGVALIGTVTAQIPKYAKALVNVIESIAYEILSCIALAILFPLNLERYDPKEKSQIKEGEIPVLFIHGFLGSSNNWVYLKRRLQEKERTNLFTINLGNPLLSITDYAEKVRKKVEEIKTLTGSDELIIVAHSMGGLVAREFTYNHNTQNINVRKIITLGTPLAGTNVAYLASWISKCAKEMTPHSSLITRLKKQANEHTSAKQYHVGTKVDLIILPRESATDKANEQDTETITLDVTPHAGYLFSDTAADIVAKEVLNVQPISPDKEP